MEKVISIGNKEVRLNNNVSWTMEYRDQFGKDIVPAIMPLMATMVEGVSSVISETGGDISVTGIAEALQGRSMEIMLPLFQIEFVDTIIDITWAMAKVANETIDPPKRWVRQFEEFPLDVIIPEVGEMLFKGFVSSKNLARLKSLGADLKGLQPSRSTISFSQGSNED